MFRAKLSAATAAFSLAIVLLAPGAMAEWISSPSVLATVAATGGPFGLELSSDGSRAWVTTYSGNSVRVFDTATHLEIAGSPISVGATPWDVVLSPDGNSAWVSNYNVTTFPPGQGTTVSVIDTRTNPPSVTGSVTVGTGPTGMAINSTGTRLWVANYNSSSVSVVDTTLTPPTVIQTVSLPGKSPLAVSISPDGLRALVVDYLGTVSIVSTSTYAVLGQASVGSALQSAVFSSDGTQAWVTGSRVYLMDTTTSTPSLITTSTAAANGGIALSPDGTRVWIVSQFANAVNLLDSSTLAVIPGAQLSFGQQPQQIALSSNGTEAWVTGFMSETVAILGTGYLPSGSGDSSQWPIVSAQAFAVAAGTDSSLCGILAPESVDWPGIAHLHGSGWTISYAQWPNEGMGGWVCTRQPVYGGTGWTVR